MSFRAKAFFGFSVVSAVVVIPWVHYVQKEQREVLREGPSRDAKRRSEKNSKKLTPQQLERAAEYEEQKRLREEYSRDQDVNAVGTSETRHS